MQLNQLLDAMQQLQSLQDLIVLEQHVDETIMNIRQGGKRSEQHKGECVHSGKIVKQCNFHKHVSLGDKILLSHGLCQLTNVTCFDLY